MNIDEMKNRISLVLKDPILQQGFECICKEIAELKKVCKETQELLDKQIEATFKLDKENAELKGLKDISTLIRANNDTVTTLMQLNNMLVGKNQQLTKAKKIIKEFMKVTEIYLKQGDDLMEKNILRCARDMAEQFLSEVEK